LALWMHWPRINIFWVNKKMNFKKLRFTVPYKLIIIT
jgi:hypothetical protein